MTSIVAPTDNRPVIGIGLLLIAMVGISFNDVMIKLLAGDYPLHQMVLTRAIIGLLFTMVFLQMEGGFAQLRTPHLHLHIFRSILLVFANSLYFMAVAAMPLADATALFFVAPLMITLLSIPVLGERLGPWRIGAVTVGFGGVLLMVQPGAAAGGFATYGYIVVLPILAAACYAGMQVMTRLLAGTAKASAMAAHVQIVFAVVSLGVWVAVGDGRYAEGTDNPSLVFLLRAWIWPTLADWPLFIGLGINAGIIGYTLAQAYRITHAGTLAPFEYVALPLAILWGYLFFMEWPRGETVAGIVLIVGSGLFVFIRENRKVRPPRRTTLR